MAGGRAVQVKGARVLHELSELAGLYSPFTVYHGDRNRIWLNYKSALAVLYRPPAPIRLLFDAYLLVRILVIGIGPTYARAIRDGFGSFHKFSDDRKRLLQARRLKLDEFLRSVAWLSNSILRRWIDLKTVESAND